MKTTATTPDDSTMDSDATFRAFALEAGAAMLLEEGEVPAHFILILPDGKFTYLPLDMGEMGNATYKAAACKIFRHLALDEGVTHYAFLTESRIATSDKDETIDANTIPPSERPDRREVLTIVGGAPGRPFHSMREILRDAEGKVIGLGRDEADDLGGTVSGRFTGLLDPDPAVN